MNQKYLKSKTKFFLLIQCQVYSLINNRTRTKTRTRKGRDREIYKRGETEKDSIS